MYSPIHLLGTYVSSRSAGFRARGIEVSHQDPRPRLGSLVVSSPFTIQFLYIHPFKTSLWWNHPPKSRKVLRYLPNHKTSTSIHNQALRSSLLRLTMILPCHHRTYHFLRNRAWFYVGLGKGAAYSSLDRLVRLRRASGVIITIKCDRNWKVGPPAGDNQCSGLRFAYSWYYSIHRNRSC